MTAGRVNATLSYSTDYGKPIDFYLYKPDPSVELQKPGTDKREVEIADAWPKAENLSVDREGFEIKEFRSEFQNFENDDAIKSEFYAQIISFVRQHTGAARVEVFDHTIRMRRPADDAEETEVQRPAVKLIHSDYTIESAPQRVRDILGDEADTLLSKRVAFYNVWKPLYDVVEELPLAVCDATTSSDDDMLLMNLKYRDRTGEIYVVRHAPSHRWYYFPRMMPHHALLLKTYDSETDGRARFMAHTAFEDPNTPANARPRQSIELRTMAFF